jgi:hypothetical protein
MRGIAFGKMQDYNLTDVDASMDQYLGSPLHH